VGVPGPGRRQSSTRWQTFALLVASLLVSASLAELYLRFFNPIDSLLLETHPRYLYRLIPGARRLFRRTAEDGAARILVKVNKAGYRGSELYEPKRMPRIAVYGDSFVLASLTTLDETFPVQLARKIEGTIHGPVEAVNAGVLGYGPDQECLRLEDEIDRLAPDVLVVAIYSGNDFGDLMRNKIFRIAGDGLRLNPYSLGRAAIASFPDQPGTAPWSMLARGLKHLVVASAPGLATSEPEPPTTERGLELRMGGYIRRARGEYLQVVERNNYEVRNLFGDTYDAGVSLTPKAQWARYSRDLMERVMVRIEGVARAHGVPLLFVFIPSAIDVCDGPYWASWRRAAISVRSSYRPETLTDVLCGIAESHGFEYVNLFRPFRDAGADRLYFRRDGHWNAAGQALAVNLAMKKVVADALLRR
jgi:hypothetical protein